MAALSEPVLVVFGDTSGSGTAYVTGRYLTEDKIWNKFNTTSAAGSTFSSIQDGSGNTLDGVSIQLGAPVSGANGRVTTIDGDTSILNTYLDTSVASGVYNNNGGSNSLLPAPRSPLLRIVSQERGRPLSRSPRGSGCLPGQCRLSVWGLSFACR